MPDNNQNARREMWTAIVLLWLAGNALRITILAVPPVIAMIRDEFALSATEVGLLSSIPPALFAIAALAGSLLVARLGVRAALVGGLMLVAAGSALRGLSTSYAVLFATTILMSTGAAIMQPIMPTTVRQWLPRRIGLGTAVYTNGLLVGEVIAASITLPFLLVPFGWQVALAVWAVPAAVVLALWLIVTPASEAAVATAGAWLPDLRSGRMIRVGLLMGGASVVYFGMNTWVPDTLDARQSHSLIPLTLGALNAMQLPVSLWLVLRGDTMLGRRWPYVLAGVGSLVGVVGYALAPAASAPIWAGLAGAAASLAFILNLGLPALFSPSEVARTSGLMFTVGYGAAFFGPALGGFAWDWTGQYRFALLPMLVGGLAMLAFGSTLPAMRIRPATRPGESAAES